MLFSVALFALSAPVDDVLPSDISRNFAAAHGALRSGDDEAALARWKRARAAFDALPAHVRIDPAVRDAAVRRELWLADQAKRRFDAIVVPDNLEDAIQIFEEKQRLFVFLVGNPEASGDDFAGAYRRVIALKPALRGMHCLWADTIARYERWLEQLPCASSLDEENCKLFKAYRAREGSYFHDEIERQYAACRL